jgi:tRNA (guanosine-2'-O-)-methyltransferase
MPSDTDGPVTDGQVPDGPVTGGSVAGGAVAGGTELADGTELAGAAPASAGGPPRQLRPTDVKRLNREWRRQTKGRLALLLDSVGQPFNVGSIVRTAAAFGVECVWLCGNTPDLTLAAVGKTALGTDRFLTAYRELSPVAAAKAAAEDGFRVVAVELASGAAPLFEAPLDGDVCLAIGNEDHGCSPALLAAVSSVAYIPQVGRVGSLNVAVAAAIALAEARRREWTADAALLFSATGNRSPAFT